MLNLLIDELKEIAIDPYDLKKTHDLRESWGGFMGWYSDEREKLRDYRIGYRVEKKVQIYRIGHDAEIYKKMIKLITEITLHYPFILTFSKNSSFE